MQVSQTTYKKLDIDNLTIKKYNSWVLLTLASQMTLGSLILLNTTGAAEFGALSSDELVEMGAIIAEVESKLKVAFNYDKINYLMLRMKDPEVHFDIIPRYSEDREFQGKLFRNQGFATIGVVMDNKNQMASDELAGLHQYLVDIFNT